MTSKGWIGVDLDGTLAHYDGWVGATHIGEPVPKMVARVKAWLAEGRMVKVFTARVATIDHVVREEITRAVGDWCLVHVGFPLPVTCVKDFGMVELWDDRCVQVVPNTGEAIVYQGEEI